MGRTRNGQTADPAPRPAACGRARENHRTKGSQHSSRNCGAASLQIICLEVGVRCTVRVRGVCVHTHHLARVRPPRMPDPPAPASRVRAVSRVVCGGWRAVHLSRRVAAARGQRPAHYSAAHIASRRLVSLAHGVRCDTCERRVCVSNFGESGLFWREFIFSPFLLLHNWCMCASHERCIQHVN